MTNNIATVVKIKLVTVIRPVEGESETYEMWLQGSYIEKLGSAYLRYEEIQNEQTIFTTIKITEHKAFIMRSGAIHMRLPLNTVEPQIGHYEGEFGSLPLMIHTYTLNFERPLQQEKSGQFSVQYDLVLGGQKVGNYTVNIQFTEVMS